METIDITPTWTAAAQIYLMVLDNPKASKESRKSAHDEILRMAAIADRANSALKNGTLV